MRKHNPDGAPIPRGSNIIANCTTIVANVANPQQAQTNAIVGLQIPQVSQPQVSLAQQIVSIPQVPQQQQQLQHQQPQQQQLQQISQVSTQSTHSTQSPVAAAAAALAANQGVISQVSTVGHMQLHQQNNRTVVPAPGNVQLASY